MSRLAIAMCTGCAATRPDCVSDGAPVRTPGGWTCDNCRVVMEYGDLLTQRYPDDQISGDEQRPEPAECLSFDQDDLDCEGESSATSQQASNPFLASLRSATHFLGNPFTTTNSISPPVNRVEAISDGQPVINSFAHLHAKHAAEENKKIRRAEKRRRIKLRKAEEKREAEEKAERFPPKAVRDAAQVSQPA